MKGDFTRDTFRQARHYSSVRLQQGRVLLDAEWNEQIDIEQHASLTTAADIIGGCGAVVNGTYDSFHVETDGEALAFKVLGGRFYVDGSLVEYEDANGVPLTGQPFLPPNPPIIRADASDAGKPYSASEVGMYVAYLDVWQRHITVLEDPDLREIALNGPDTATRTQTIWQVFLQPAPGATCAGLGEEWAPGRSRTGGQLRARSRPQQDPADQCQVPAGGGYRRLENQLYRVEVNTGGDLGAATFKWSRDNGTVTALIKVGESDAGSLTVGNPGRDIAQSFAGGQLVEVTDDYHEWLGQPGALVTLVDVQGDVLIIPDNSVNLSEFPANPKVRRWEGTGTIATGTAAGSDGYLPLEDGVEVKFEAGFYKAGDYWLIPARTLLGDVEWPQEPAASGGTEPAAQGAAGVRHHYCPLAIVQVSPGPGVSVVSDCRPIFPPLTGLKRLLYLSGDGQEALPGDQLPQPLEVAVANGGLPVTDAVVRFAVFSPANLGQLVDEKGNTGTQLDVAVDANGIACCRWTLDGDPAHSSQVVTAHLLDDAKNPVNQPPIQFNARAAIALYYAGGDGQPALNGRPLPLPVEVRVSDDGDLGVGRTVRFRDGNANGRMAAAAADLTNGGAANPFDAVADANGIARCFWLPDWSAVPAGTRPTATVEARLLANGAEVGSPIHFNAFLNIASEVGYTPNCPDLAGVSTVQDAIDALCKRPTGTGGGACITVGSQQQAQFNTLQDAILKSIEQGLTDICICLLPGDLQIDGDLTFKAGAATSISISGCGRASRILMGSGHLAFAGLGAVSFGDLEIQALGTPAGPNRAAMLSFADCASVSFADCALLAFDSQVPLLTIGPGAQRISLERNVIRSYGAEQFAPLNAMLGGVLSDLPNILALKKFDDFRDGSAQLVDRWLSDPALRGQIAKALQDLVAQQTGKVGQGFLAGLTTLALVLGSDRPVPSKLVAILDEVRAAAARLAPKTAVTFAEEQARTALEDNEIGGVFSVYGDPDPAGLGKLTAAPQAGGVGRAAFDIVSHRLFVPFGLGGTLHLRNNRITQMTVGASVATALANLAAQGPNPATATVVPAYRLVSLTNNVFANQLNAWFGQSVTLASNVFPAADRPDLQIVVAVVRSLIGVCIAEGATYTGNQGRFNTPAVLIDMTAGRAGASTDPNITTNLFMTIANM